ncbi:uncharacterized protein RCH25_049229 [Pelodytes ibericus]
MNTLQMSFFGMVFLLSAVIVSTSDAEKAFNRVSWNFLDQVLKKIGIIGAFKKNTMNTMNSYQKAKAVGPPFVSASPVIPFTTPSQAMEVAQEVKMAVIEVKLRDLKTLVDSALEQIATTAQDLASHFKYIKLTISEKEKPGICPPERFYTGMNPEVCKKACSNDSECDGDKKCCPDNCYKVCKPPAKEKPGNCPIVKKQSTCTDMCSTDNECANESKCCFGTCGMKCTPSVGEKDGVCEQKTVFNCFIAERSFCDTDTSCSNDEKCCPSKCNHECTKPYQETTS